MLKVVLIDDEPFVIEGLMEMIAWQEYGFKISGVAHDGKTGLQMISEMEPDLVITDIRMPELDGLTMIKQAQEQINKDICFLVFSGYNDFDYIKTALDLRSLSYILKPIDTDEIHSELERIKLYLDKQENRIQRMEENIQLVTRMTLKRIIDEPYKKALIDRAFFLLDFKHTYGYTYVLIQKVEKFNSKDIDFIHYIKSYIQFHQLKEVILDHSDSHMKFIVSGEALLISNFISEIKQGYYSKKMDLQDLSLVFSFLCKELDILKATAFQIQERKRFAFYEKIKCEKLPQKERQYFSKELSLINLVELKEKVIHASDQDLQHYQNSLLRSIRQEKLDPNLLLIKWDSFLNMMNKECKQSFQLEAFFIFEEFKQQLNKTIEQYRSLTYKADNQDILYDIKTYIKNHYSEDIKLKSIAKKFGYNSVYLGQLFIKNEKLKFNDYVLNIRIEKAKELLLYSDKCIKEVALTVGFKNPDYFVQKFKEVEGVSPSKY